MKRILSIFLIFVMVMGMFSAFPLVASAEVYHETIYSNKFYYIEHVGSGKLVDIDDWHCNDNGTQLQIWDKWQGHNNQVYGLVDTGDGWKIFSYASMKIIEVRDNSHDEFAQVAQWDNHNNKCGRWNIIYNPDGTISFENCESGLYMNVFGNGNSNGTKLIQYHHDGTDAEKFRLYRLDQNDVLSAKWTREISNDEIAWTYMGSNFNITNWTNWKAKWHYPTPGQEYLMKVEYLDPKTVGEIVKARAYVDEAWSQVWKAVKDGGTEKAVSKALEKLHIGDVPFLGESLAILEIIFNNEENNEWNAFLDTVQYDETGRCSGVIVITYVKIVRKGARIAPADNSKAQLEQVIDIDSIEVKKYQQWSGDDFAKICLDTSNMKGKWEYNFK